MKFVKISELRAGMRLARPIYNKNGVLLFERDSKITSQGIASIANFGLIGLFILEPAEPCPPMSPEDIEFERFQTVNVFSLIEEIEKINMQGKTLKLQTIVANIIKSYGHLENKINFNQNLRSEEDARYKHALNVAILAAMMCNKLNVRVEDRLDIVTTALLRSNVPVETLEKMFSAEPNIKRFVTQAEIIEEGVEKGELNTTAKIMMGSRILAVANAYDNITAMRVDKTPESEVTAAKMLLASAKVYDQTVVMALLNSINILVQGVCVELNTGAKALVLSENTQNLFEPMVLEFSKNEIMDLSDRRTFGDVEIVDVMKTMDNRHVMDTDALKNMGMM